MQVNVTYEGGQLVVFVLADTISMIEACESFAKYGKVTKVEFPERAEEPAIKMFGPSVRVVTPSPTVGHGHEVELLYENTRWSSEAFATNYGDACKIAQDLRRRLIEGEL